MKKIFLVFICVLNIGFVYSQEMELVEILARFSAGYIDYMRMCYKFDTIYH